MELKNITMNKEYLRNFINDECIWRTNDPNKRIPGKQVGTSYTWQFYLRRATCDSICSHIIAKLFWEEFENQDVFQIGACEAAGVQIACSIQSYARFVLKRDVPIFTIKKEPKSYGLRNLTEGIIHNELPIVLVDDLAGSQETLLKSYNVLTQSGFRMYNKYFTVVDKSGTDVIPHRVYLDDLQLVSLFNCDDFDLSVNDYVDSTNKQPKWTGRIIKIKEQ